MRKSNPRYIVNLVHSLFGQDVLDQIKQQQRSDGLARVWSFVDLDQLIGGLSLRRKLAMMIPGKLGLIIAYSDPTVEVGSPPINRKQDRWADKPGQGMSVLVPAASGKRMLVELAAITLLVIVEEMYKSKAFRGWEEVDAEAVQELQKLYYASTGWPVGEPLNPPGSAMQALARRRADAVRDRDWAGYYDTPEAEDGC